MFKDLQNMDQYELKYHDILPSDKSLLDPPSDFYTKLPPSILPVNKAQLCTQMNNHTTSTLSKAKLDPNNGNNKSNHNIWEKLVFLKSITRWTR